MGEHVLVMVTRTSLHGPQSRKCAEVTVIMQCCTVCVYHFDIWHAPRDRTTTRMWTRTCDQTTRTRSWLANFRTCVRAERASNIRIVITAQYEYSIYVHGKWHDTQCSPDHVHECFWVFWVSMKIFQLVHNFGKWAHFSLVPKRTFWGEPTCSTEKLNRRNNQTMHITYVAKTRCQQL